MKNWIVLSILSLGLMACTSPAPQSPQAPLDMRTVEQYQANVYHHQPKQAEQTHSQVTLPLNQSDNQVKRKANPVRSTPVILMPSIGYHYGHYRYR